MKKYIINPEYTICENDEMDVVLTANMEQVYILQDVESLIVKCFSTPQTIKEAIVTIRERFTLDSFNVLECESFISEIINAGIVVLADDKNQVAGK